MSFRTPLLGTTLYEMTKLGKNCDFRLVCDDKSILVHQGIVFSQVPIIAAECDEGTNGQKGSYRCEGFTSFIVDHMVEFVYTGDYTSESVENPLIPHIDVGKVADHFDLPALRAIVYRKIDETLRTPLGSSGDILRKAYDLTTDMVIQDKIASCLGNALQLCFQTESPYPDEPVFSRVLRLACDKITRLENQVRELEMATRPPARRGFNAYAPPVPK
ncbi:uncharacterized protein BO97DRAFT_195446 [Aspergillus homomorphus CBS 101889]|uniref:BTB domain-containing protein n=1 Tax=Aspergillus homomorphus (strain CBS 101889) TaxID=1450537 RepID=A0A395HLF9_ASPHC|nr:hypothetical protein BO97DRAFT_195446 [Aspergillus homomorphus CBS 101889]RAL08772.1 hypothetical protein BO97DRAFT_195446 [Aspergillus homomorphus CBS 101889]